MEKEKLDMTAPIIFSHYGASDYLSRTLRCAALTNENKRRIFIGDIHNREIALQCGWEHFESAALMSDLRSEFNRVFRPIRGKRYPLQINNGDHLKYVFERWYIVQQFCLEQNINYFWHFDSDVMMLEPLAQFESGLLAQGLDYTKQCNDTCLNGFVSSNILADYCMYTTSLFLDEAFVARRQAYLDESAPRLAFTEMAAFDMFSKSSSYRGRHLAAAAPGWWFDDTLCQDHGFEMTSPKRYGKEYDRVKNIIFEDDGFHGLQHGERVRFATANCSWVHIGVFDWFLANVEGRAKGQALPKTGLSDVNPSFRLRMKYGVRDMKRSVIDMVRR
jgi:hypothetical protein